MNFKNIGIVLVFLFGLFIFEDAVSSNENLHSQITSTFDTLFQKQLRSYYYEISQKEQVIKEELQLLITQLPPGLTVEEMEHQLHIHVTELLKGIEIDLDQFEQQMQRHIQTYPANNTNLRKKDIIHRMSAMVEKSRMEIAKNLEQKIEDYITS